MSKSISFVSENVIEEKKKKRQEEWEKNRKEDDPLGLFIKFTVLYLFNLNSHKQKHQKKSMTQEHFMKDFKNKK